MSLVVDARVRRGGFSLDVAFSVAPGSTLAVLGANGAGKTTLLRAIAGLAPVDSGSIVCDGELFDDGRLRWVLPERRSVGVVFQDQRLFPNLTALDNVAFGLRARGEPVESAREQAHAELVAFGVGGAAPLRPVALSGGQAQRVALARTLVIRPRVLLLDEPFAAIDTGARPEVREVAMGRIAEISGMTLFVTHDVADAAIVTDAAIELVDGRISSTDGERSGGHSSASGSR